MKFYTYRLCGRSMEIKKGLLLKRSDGKMIDVSTQRFAKLKAAGQIESD